MSLKSAPPNWSIAANLPIALFWIVGIPFAVCWFLPIPLWWAILIVPVWSLLTGRITVRWLPALTGPAIDKMFSVIGWERKQSGSLKPESETIVETTDSCIRATRPNGMVEEVSWNELTGFDIETNSLGPFEPDVYWILHGEVRGCVIPQGATGDGELLARLMKLPRFDNQAFMEAMASTSEATFPIWRKTKTQKLKDAAR